jgi:glucokinase
MTTQPGSLPVVLAIDVGGTKMAAAICDLDGRRLVADLGATGSAEGSAMVLARLEEMGHTAVRRAGRDVELVAVGVATIGIPLEHGVALAPAIPGWGSVALARHVEECFGVPAVAGNDVKAAALSESRNGALAGHDPGLYLNLGTGLASAAVVGGDVLLGANGAAGEIGYSLLSRRDVYRPLEGRKMLEDVVSGMGLAAMASERLGRSVDAYEVFERAGDDVVLAELVEEFVGHLAAHLVNLVVALDPARVVVGGGLTRSWESFSGPLERALKTGVPYPPELVLAAHPDDAALRGAVEMALGCARQVLENPARKSCVSNDNRRGM